MELVAIFWKRSKREKRVNQKQEVLTSLWQEPSLQVLLVFNGGAIALTDQEVPVAVQLCRPETTLMLMLLPLGEGAERADPVLEVGVGLTNQVSNSRVPGHSISSAPNVPLPLFDQNDPKRRLTQRTNKRFFSSFFVFLFLFYCPQGTQKKQILSKAISSSQRPHA